MYVLEILMMSDRYLMGAPQIFDGFPGDIWWMSWRYLIGVLEIFDGCPGFIS